MIILLSGAILALLLFLIPKIWNFCVPIILGWCKEEPTKDSKFRLLKDADDNIHIQFSNDGGKTYNDLEDTPCYNETRAKEKLGDIIAKLNKTEEILYEYDPHRLRITDGSEKEFMEEDTL